jgi:hypothetical protein
MKKSAFADYDELWAILNSLKTGRAQEEEGDKRNKNISSGKVGEYEKSV